MASDDVTAEMIAKWKEAFVIFDKNKDGKITQDELALTMATMGHKCTQKELQDMMEMAAEGNNQKSGYGSANAMSFSDFQYCQTKQLKHNMTEDQLIKAAYKVFDKDDKGYISAAELRRIMSELGEKLTDKEAFELLVEIDKDGDGRVNIDDFSKTMRTTVEPIKF